MLAAGRPYRSRINRNPSPASTIATATFKTAVIQLAARTR